MANSSKIFTEWLEIENRISFESAWKMGAPLTEVEKPLEDYYKLCRSCLIECGEMKDMFEWGFADDYTKLTNVVLNRNEEISPLLCSKCEEILQKFREFRSQCFSSDILLKRLAKRKLEETTGKEAEIEATETGNDISYLLYSNKLVILITAADNSSRLNLACPHECPVEFNKKNNLLTHLVRDHQINEKTFEINMQYFCVYPDCPYNINSEHDKWFTARKFLNQHYNKVHKSKIFRCTVCNQRYSTSSDFKRHLKSCNMKFPCQKCGMIYHSNENLLVHLKRRHPDLHKQYKEEKKANKKKARIETETSMVKNEFDNVEEYICDSPKRSFATQTLKAEDNIKNDVRLPPWLTSFNKKDSLEAKTDEISTQTVFEDILSIKSQNSEEESIFCTETVSLSDIQTQTFPVEFGLSRSNKETITSGTQSPDLSMKETQTCVCLYDSPKLNFKMFDSMSSSPSSNLASAETQTLDIRYIVKSDKMLSSSAETQTCFGDDDSKDSL